MILYKYLVGKNSHYYDTSNHFKHCSFIWRTFKVGASKSYVNTGFDWPLGLVGSGDNENVTVSDIPPSRKLLSEDTDRNIWLASLICEAVGVGISSSSSSDEDCRPRSGWLPTAPIMAMEAKLDIPDMTLLRRRFPEKGCMACNP